MKKENTKKLDIAKRTKLKIQKISRNRVLIVILV